MPIVIVGCESWSSVCKSPASEVLDYNISVNFHFVWLVVLGWILIDRCGKHFPLILNFLRDGAVPLPQNEVELQEVLTEAKYYCIEQLVEMCEKALEKKKEEHDPICRVPLITSSKEERQLVTGKKVSESLAV